MAFRSFVIVLGAIAGVAVAVMRRGGADAGRAVPGGILMGHTGAYDAASRILLGPLFDRIAADVAAVASPGARLLEVGCGPGQLSIRLARRHGLDVVGVDLDPAMIERARANALRPAPAEAPRPSFVVGDAASLEFPDASFDLVVSTFSIHHWADPAAGLAEIARVLRPGGRALIWDLRPGIRPHLFGPRHAHMPDPVEHARGTALRMVSATPWRWPWRFTIAQRTELVTASAARIGSPT